ncbi:MAG: Chaperone protein DnaJ [Syntrophorhabdus sp. PtaB.Bin047]|nr:MAG: Chaperone protein DnaJ [Syntrophorhabdus sp. PtaB.Bin047]
MNGKDYYEVLEINCEATDRQIKESYRRLAFQYHPDRNAGDPGAVERMKGINEAYAVLSDPVKRQRYDSLRQSCGASAHDRFREGYSDNDIFRGSDINQIFEEISRSFGFRGFEDIFKEVYGTGYRTFEFRNGGVFGRGFIFTGRTGQGALRHGARQSIGSRILGKLAGYALKKMTGLGTDNGGDRYDSLRLTSEQAKNGGKVPYTDKGSSRSILISVPPGVSQGQVIRLRGLGSQGGPLTVPGDLYLEVEIARPFLQRVRSFLKDKADGLRPAD